MSPPAFTPEQRAAIAARTGSSLLAANAGSGKTAVMVARIAAAVREDGVPVGAILALTFTEKAAGELAERLRRRLTELGEAEHARAVDAAWIGTIHGFCARLLRSQPLAAGLDPRFEVLEEAPAGRLAAAAYEDALEGWASAHGAAAIDLAASYGPGLRELILGTYATLRARGLAAPRLSVPREAPPPDTTALSAACAAAERDLATAGDGVRVAAARAALAACREILGPGEEAAGAGADAVGTGEDAARAAGEAGGAAPPWPGVLAAAELKGGAKALTSAACEAYREAWGGFREACAAYHARSALPLLDGLLSRFGVAYAEAKAARTAVDFEDLELRARDLLAEPRTRRRWAERFALLMVDEFQDTNAVQLEILEALERDNLFAVGDEFQSIYRFRHADVAIFRARAAALDPASVRGLAVNFRSREELLDVLNAAFAPVLGERFTPLRAGRPLQDPGGALRLFDLAPAGEPPVELLVTATKGWDELGGKLGLAGGGDQPWRRAEARLIAHRLRAEVDAGRRPGEVVVLVRATTSLRLLEEALEEQGLPTYVVGGRGYWSQEQVRDGLAWLRVLANPHDEAALLTVLASPFCGATSDDLIALAGRANGGLWHAVQGEVGGLPAGERIAAVARLLAAERERAERAPVEMLLEQAIVATGYDLAVLARPGGDRRLANLRKLMRLAREFERAEGRDLRAFLTDAAERDLAEAREGEAALESEGLDAVRLMTIHRAKGLEFPVVCVADLGRKGAGLRPPLLVGRDGTAGLRLSPLGGGETVPTAAWERLANEEAQADAEEERRLFYVALTRARDLLILSGGTDIEKWPEPRAGGAPIDWIARAVAEDPARPPGVLERAWDGRSARVTFALNTPGTLPPAALKPRAPARAAASTALPAVPALVPGRPQRAKPAPQRLSYTQLSDYARCGYRFYLERVLRLPKVIPPPQVEGEEAATAGISPLLRGSIVHRALEALDFRDPRPPTADTVRKLAAEAEATLTHEEVAEVQAFVSAFADSPLCARLAQAPTVTREAAFAFALEPDGAGPLVSGFVDVLASEPGGGALVIDYKTDHVAEPDTPAAYIERAYETQRLVYALAALRDGALSVEVAHCLLERPGEPVTVTYTAEQAPDLTARIAELASGVLAHEHPVTPHPHRDLCGDCPGRKALCSHPEAMTLRPPPAPWPGAPDPCSPAAPAASAAGPPPR